MINCSLFKFNAIVLVHLHWASFKCVIGSGLTPSWRYDLLAHYFWPTTSTEVIPFFFEPCRKLHVNELRKKTARRLEYTTEYKDQGQRNNPQPKKYKKQRGENWQPGSPRKPGVPKLAQSQWMMICCTLLCSFLKTRPFRSLQIAHAVSITSVLSFFFSVTCRFSLVCVHYVLRFRLVVGTTLLVICTVRDERGSVRFS
jgi:hypothetical protein